MVIDKDVLETEYLINKMSETKIAEKYNTSRTTISKLLNEYNIEKRKSDKELHNAIKNITKDMFYDMYVTNNMSYDEIAAKYNASVRQVQRLNNNKFHCVKTKENKSKNIKNGLSKYMQSDKFKSTLHESIENRKKSNLEKYGCENVFQLTEVKEKIKKTNLEKYGSENPMNNIDIRQKVSDSLRLKFMDKFERSEQEVSIVNSKKKLKSFIMSLNKKDRTLYNIANQLKYSLSYITAKVSEFELNDLIQYQNGTSHYEDDIVKYLLEIGVPYDDIKRRSRKIGNIELDILVSSKNIAIEFNGDYWHTVDKVGKKYHYNKSKICEDNNIRLIHVYEYQWNDPIKQLILKSIIKNALGLNENKIYARKCVVKVLNGTDVVDFSNINSLHGHRNASVYLGLFYNDELVELMTFGHPFFARDKSIDYEVIRSITKIGYTVVGGMNKLFKYFINNYNPNKVLYYVDYNTHNGNSMANLGFNFLSYSTYGTINIAKTADVIKKYGYVFNRKPMNNSDIKTLIEAGKVATICDAGIKKYIWNKEDVKD